MGVPCTKSFHSKPPNFQRSSPHKISLCSLNQFPFFFLPFFEDVNDFYTISEKISGYGAYGTVRKGFNKYFKGSKLAIKTIPKKKLNTEKRKRNMERELEILKVIEHPNLVSFNEYFEDVENVHIVTEYLNGEDLLSYTIKKGKTCLPEEEIAEVVKQIIEATIYLHENNIVHRDLKPENFLFANLNSNFIKIIDFGLSTYISEQDEMNPEEISFVGTPYYIAPEIINRNCNDLRQCDVWSIGIILFFFAVGYHPFSGSKKEEILSNIINGKLEFEEEYWKDKSEELRDLITRLLEFEPNERIGLKEALSHSFFKKKNDDGNEQLIEEKTSEFIDYMFSICWNEEENTTPNNWIDNYQFRKIILLTYIKFMNPEEENFSLGVKIFQYLDSKNKGYIKSEDFNNAIKNLGINISSKTISKIIRKINKPLGFIGNEISYHNFMIYYCAFYNKMSEQSINDLFSYFYKNESENYIDSENLDDIPRMKRRVYFPGEENVDEIEICSLKMENFKEILIAFQEKNYLGSGIFTSEKGLSIK